MVTRHLPKLCNIDSIVCLYSKGYEKQIEELKLNSNTLNKQIIATSGKLNKETYQLV